MPIREALRRLQGEGLVVLEPNRGARVRSMDRSFVENLFATRGTLEALLAGQAASHCRRDETLLFGALVRDALPLAQAGHSALPVASCSR